MQDEHAIKKRSSEGIEALAWKPLRMDSTFIKMSRDEKKTLFLFRTLMSQLNKLSFDNSSKIKDKIKNLPIDTLPKTQKAVEMIHEKAINEKEFCSLYAQVCDLFKDKQFTDETGIFKTFPSLLRNRCKEYFDANVTENLVYERRKFEIDLVTCQETRKRLLEECFYEENGRSKRFVGNCFFIAEIFKFGMIEKETLFELIDCLLKLSGNVAAECVCAILTTIGKFCEDEIGGISSVYFDEIETLCNEEDLLPGVRFLLQDVLDLRRNAWCPRIQRSVPEISNFDSCDDESDKPSESVDSCDGEPDNAASFESVSSESINSCDGESDDTASIAKSPDNSISISNQIDVSDSLDSSSELKQANLSLSKEVTLGSSIKKSDEVHSIVADGASVDQSTNSAQNKHTSSGKGTIPRQPSTQNTIQDVATSSCSSSSASAYPMNVVSITIFLEYDSGDDVMDSITSFETQINFEQRSKAVHEIMEYVVDHKPESAWKYGSFLANLSRRGSITKEYIIEPLKFFLGRIVVPVDRLTIREPLFKISLSLIGQGCLQIEDSEIELPKNTMLLNFMKQVHKFYVSLLDDLLMERLLQRLVKDNSDEIIRFIDSKIHVEKMYMNPAEFTVPKLMSSICQIIYDSKKKKDKETNAHGESVIYDTMMKYERLLKNYIKNENDLEVQCLSAVHEFAEKADYPQGLLCRIFQSLYNLKLVSRNSIVQWKNAHLSVGPRMEFEAALLRPFFELLEKTNIQKSKAPKIKYTVEFLTSFRDLPECNKPVQIITEEIAAKVIQTQTNNEMKNEPKVRGFNKTAYLKVIANSNSFTTSSECVIMKSRGNKVNSPLFYAPDERW